MQNKAKSTLEKIDALRFSEKCATPGPWFVATGNSWRRILQEITDRKVIVPTRAHDDWPDLLATMTDLEHACTARNMHPKFLTLCKKLAQLAEQGAEVPSDKILAAINETVEE